jgi:hypothetical protein
MSTDRFVVAIKDSAVERNEAVRAFVEGPVERESSVLAPHALADDRRRLRFDSRADADETARALSSDGARAVRIQTVAPQDGDDADAYLVGASRRDGEVPDADPGDGWRFAVDANQYGALGEALLTPGGVATPLACYVRDDLGLDADDDLSVDVGDDPDSVTVPELAGEWQPDCRLDAAVAGRRVATYRCEIKTGDGSFERNQRAVAEAAARETRVLLIRVDVSDLPQSYEVSFERIGEEPERSGDSAGQTTFGEWE